AMVIFQAEVVGDPVLEKFDAFQRAGGRVMVVGTTPIKNIAGKTWSGAAKAERVGQTADPHKWRQELADKLQNLQGVDGKLDGVWTTRRGRRVFAFNSTAKPVTVEIDRKLVRIAPKSIYEKPE